VKIEIADIPSRGTARFQGKWMPIWIKLLSLPPGKAVRWRVIETWEDREFRSLYGSLAARIKATFEHRSVKLRVTSRQDGVYVWLEPAQGTPAQAE